MATLLTDALIADGGPPRPGAIRIEGGRIAAVGDLPGEGTSLGGRLVTPGLIDCHTHVVHGGHRAAEFERRLEGASYEEVARAGGGILSTVRATRGRPRTRSWRRPCRGWTR